MATNAITTTTSAGAMPVVAGFNTLEGFELIQRVSKVFNSSDMVPKIYQGPENRGNCIIALNMAYRLGVEPLMVMQNLYIIQGKPAWSTQFMISMFNGCGRFAPIRYRATGVKGTDSQGIIAYTYDKSTGDLIEGEEVTIAIAKSEGWYSKGNSKWKTMPGQMLRYRAASWLIRTTAPELSLGLISKEEVIDITPTPVQAPSKPYYKPAPPANVDIETGEITNTDDTATVVGEDHAMPADFEAYSPDAEAIDDEDMLNERP